jgi:chromosome segregation protein
LTQRNRRDELVRASEAAVRAELAAAAESERRGAECSLLEDELDRVVGQYRVAVRGRDEAREDERRTRALIERRRAAPEDDPYAARRVRLEAELSAERAARERAERERAERGTRIARLRAAIGRDEELLPAVRTLIEALDEAAAAVADQRAVFEAALAADRQAEERLAAELRACAQQEAALHEELHRRSEALTDSEVRLQRARDRAADVQRELRGLAAALQLDAEPRSRALPGEERQALSGSLQRLARRREQLGPVNPLAQQEYADAVAHVEELERTRGDLETALRELETLIAETDRQIKETFEQTFAAAARSFEQVAERLFPGGRGRLRLVAERDGPARILGGLLAPGEREEGELDDSEPSEEQELQGVEIEMTPAGKEMKRLSLLSGGEKSLTALAFLFAVFLARPCPFYILDEVEAALDDVNIDRFLELLRTYSKHAQFIVVTHQKRTMEAGDSLYGVSMGGDGVSKVISRRLPPDAQAAA